MAEPASGTVELDSIQTNIKVSFRTKRLLTTFTKTLGQALRQRGRSSLPADVVIEASINVARQYAPLQLAAEIERLLAER